MYSVLFFMVIHYQCVIWPNYCFCPVYHTVWKQWVPEAQSLAYFLKTLVLHVYNYSTANARALIFHLSIPFDNFDDFHWVPTFFTLWPWPLNLTYFSKVNLANNFWTVSTRAFIYFKMSISSDKTFLWVPTFFTLSPWPWSLAYF